MSEILPLRKGTGRVPYGAIVKLRERLLAAALELDAAITALDKDRAMAVGDAFHAACAEYRKAISW